MLFIPSFDKYIVNTFYDHTLEMTVNKLESLLLRSFILVTAWPRYRGKKITSICFYLLLFNSDYRLVEERELMSFDFIWPNVIPRYEQQSWTHRIYSMNDCSMNTWPRGLVYFCLDKTLLPTSTSLFMKSGLGELCVSV